jgi:hypothetical protein
MKCLPFVATAAEAPTRSTPDEQPRVIPFISRDAYRAREAARRRYAEQKRFWSRWQANPRIRFSDDE